MSKIKTYTPAGMDVDSGAVTQMENCLNAAPNVGGVLSADHHLGYSMPIGGTIAYTEHVSPSGVGYDIGCGNMAVATSLSWTDISSDMPKIMDEVANQVAFGVGRDRHTAVDHPIFDRIARDAPFQGIRDLGGLAKKQLGTVGSGNHYVDIFREEKTDRIWIGVHFGSRGFGHKIASGFLALAQNKGFNDHAGDGELMSPPVLFHIDSPLGHNYIEAMTLAGEYAYAGRETVVKQVLGILGNPDVVDTVHNHHNYAWQEDHLDTEGNVVKAWVVRKGATPLFPGQKGFVGSSMGDNSVIIRGTEYLHAGDPVFAEGSESLWSAPHGAGRRMSRTEAKGKQKKRWYDPNGDYIQLPGTPAPSEDEIKSKGLKKKWVTEKAGKIDWTATRKDLDMKNIELRGGDADEAPGAYKKLDEVLAAHGDYVEIVNVLRPVGVAMAGAGTVDPYKD